MENDRRTQRSQNPWIAMKYLLEQRAPAGAVLSDPEGLTLVSAGYEGEEADRIAAEIWREESLELQTGAGLPVRMFADVRGPELVRLRGDVTRILATV